MFRIRVDARDAIQLLSQLEQEFSDFRPLFDILREHFVINNILDLFATDGTSSGIGSWPPTQRPNPILRDTLALFYSYTQANAPGNINIEEAKRFIWGSDIFYAEYHEEGLGQLTRQVIGFLAGAPDADREIADITDEYVQELIDRSDNFA